MKKIAVGNLGAEERAQFEHKVVTRASQRAEAHLLFSEAGAAISKAQKTVKGLFVQADGAETEGPTLAKTAAVDTFFKEYTEKQKTSAQKRYPELLKAAAAPGGRGTFPVASQKKTAPAEAKSGPQAVTSSMSGGSA